MILYELWGIMGTGGTIVLLGIMIIKIIMIIKGSGVHLLHPVKAV